MHQLAKSIMAAAALTVCLVTTSPAEAQSNFDSQFKSYPTYSGEDLELTVNESGTHWRLWSPKAQEAVVNIYNQGKGG